MALNISDSEMVVMRVVWSMGEAKVEDVRTQIAKRHSWSEATVKTFLGRLVKKGLLSTEKEGRCFIYRAQIAESEALQLMGEDLLSKICATKQIGLLTGLIQDCQLTEKDVRQLTELLSVKETVEEVECTCLSNFGSCICRHHNHESINMEEH